MTQNSSSLWSNRSFVLRTVVNDGTCSAAASVRRDGAGIFQEVCVVFVSRLLSLDCQVVHGQCEYLAYIAVFLSFFFPQSLPLLGCDQASCKTKQNKLSK